MATATGTAQSRVRLPRAVREFLATEMAGGVILVVATVIALGWANSPWRDSYVRFWHSDVRLRVGTFGFDGDLRHLVNDALMALFFFVVGLEIKRELVVGELKRWRTAAFPAVAALGGMVGPALLYTAFNFGTPGGRGWGIPMATDIAFALGVLALLGNRVPSGLKLFLLTLAIVDDVGAIAVIAIFYSHGIDWQALGVAAALVVVIVALRRGRVESPPVYVVLGLGLWLAVNGSGIHATIAGVVLGLLTPARPSLPTGVARRWARDLSDEPSAEDLRALSTVARSSLSVAERLAHDLHPLTSFVIVPLFALANAGVELGFGAFDTPGAGRVAVGIILGLVVGKLAGITLFAWLAVRLGLCSLPTDLRWPQLAGGAGIAGIGFTVSLFITELAFAGQALEAPAKVAILLASVLAAVLGAVVVYLSAGRGTSSASPPPSEPVTTEPAVAHGTL